MAESRPFSTQYKGTNIGPVPSGYIEAYSRIGQGMAEAGRELGKNVSGILETYAKAEKENEAVNTAWETSKNGTIAFLNARYGNNSTQLADFLKQDADFKSKSLTQRKTAFATWEAEKSSAKDIAAADTARTADVRRNMAEVAGRSGEIAEAGFNAAMANATINFKGVTIKGPEDIAQQREQVRKEYEQAKAEGRDVGPILAAQTRLEEAVKNYEAHNFRRTGNNLTASAIVADDAAAKQAELDRQKAEEVANAVATGAPAPKLDEKGRDEEGNIPAPVYPAGRIGDLQRQRDKAIAISKGAVVSTEVDEKGVARNVQSGSPSRRISATLTPDVIRNLEAEGVDVLKMDEEAQNLKRDQLKAAVLAAKLASVGAGGEIANDAIREINENPDAPWAQMVLASTGISAGTVLTKKILKDRAAEIARLPKNLISAGYGSYGRGAKFAKDFPTLAKLYKVGLVVGEVGANVARLAKATGVTALVEVGAEAAVGVGMGATGTGTFTENFNAYFAERVDKGIDVFRTDVQRAQNALEKFEKGMADDKKARTIAKGEVDRLNKEIEREKKNPANVTATATATPAAQPRILLADSVKSAVEQLQSGRTIEIPFPSGNDVSPLLRVIAFHEPKIKNDDGSINMSMAAQVIGENLAARVTIQDGKMIVAPVEAEPITFDQVDLASARNVDDAVEKGIRNQAIAELRSRNIPTTEDNIQYILQSGRLTDQQGTEYESEFTSGGVSRGRAIANPNRQAPMTPAEEVKYRRDLLGLNREQAEAESLMFGEVVQRPDGTVYRTPISVAGPNSRLSQIAPMDNPLLIGDGGTKEIAKKVRETAMGSTKVIEIMRDKVPTALTNLGKELHGNANHYMNADGTVNSAAVMGDEKAKREYIRVVFGSVRDLGQGLGALSASDYMFIFTQAGIPITYDQLMDKNTDYMDKVLEYFSKNYSQSTPNFIQNAMDGLVAGAKANLNKIEFETNGNVKVLYRTRSQDESGALKPLDSVKADLTERVSRLRASEMDSSNAGTFDMLRYPERYINPQLDGMKTKAEVQRYAVTVLASKTGYAPEHVFELLFPKPNKK